MAQRYTLFIGGAVLLYTVAFWQLGGASFWDPDEAHYAQTTRELLATGDWMAPFYNQQPFFDKPIFFHWLQAVPMWAFGDTEFAARFVPAVAATALVALTWWLARRTSGPEAAAMAALLLAASPGVFTLSRYAILDTLFTALLFGGVALVAVAALRGPLRLEYAGYVAIGFATLTKGPVALVLCGLAFGIALALSHDVRGRLLRLHWIRGLVLAIVVASPWFIYMLWRFGDAFVAGYVLNENVLLFATTMYANQPPVWFYLQLIALGMLPWTPLLIGRGVDQLRAAMRGDAIEPIDVLLWAWVAAVLGFFSASHFKLDHYVFPAAPALCLIGARAWRDVHSGAHAPASRVGVRLVGPTLILAGAIVAALLIRRLALPPAAMTIAAVLVGAGVVATVRYPFTSRLRVPIAPIAAMGLLYVGVLLWVIPPIEQGKVMPDVARWVSSHASERHRIATFRLNRWNSAFRFYVDRHTAMLESDEDSRQFFSDTSPYYCVMTRQLYEALRAAGVPLKVVYSQRGLWATSGRALWRREAERTEFVVTANASDL